MAYRLGWANQYEDRVYLHDQGGDFLRKIPKLGAYSEQVGDPRPNIRLENQGNQGSCTGHATSTIQEWLAFIQSKGRIKIQLSRKFAYIQGQQECGLFGRDVGATISGSIKAARKYGNCKEELCPYTAQYTTSITQAAINDAKNRLVRDHQTCQGYDDVRRVVGTLFGGVNIGVMITDAFMNDKKGIINPNHFKGRKVGGHSMAILVPSSNKTADGRPYLWGPNSWGPGVHNGGWIEWHPDCFDQFGRDHNNEMIAITDLDISSDGGGDIDENGEWTGRTIDFVTDNPHVG